VAVQSSAMKNIKLHCITATQKHQLRQQLSSIRALFDLMSNPLWLQIRSTGAEVAGDENKVSQTAVALFI